MGKRLSDKDRIELLQQAVALISDVQESIWKPLKVKVEVRGGVAYCDNPPHGVDVEIVDYDNEGR